jgi:glycosyltransferase involved in cell wall biosynthesis
LRIAFLNSWYADSAQGSGTAAAISGLRRGLENLGHQVEILSPNVSTPGFFRRLLYNIGLTTRSLASRFDLLVGFDIDGFLLSTSVSRSVCLFGVSAEEMQFERGWPRLYLAALSRLERQNARRAFRVIVPSEHSRRVAIDSYGLKADCVVVVPLGIDLEVWNVVDTYSTRRQNNPPTILSVARQYPRKNTTSLISAMPGVLRKVPDTRLRIVGGGPMLPMLRKQVASLGLEKSVEFTGELTTDDEVRKEFFEADVFALPSLQEGFGLVFLEAMAAGLPIVAARAAAVPEVVPDGEAGILVPPGDVDALAEALIRLLKDEKLRMEMGGAGRKRARFYIWEEKCSLLLKSLG